LFAYDADGALAVFGRIGDAFVSRLLGREYAHGVEARLGVGCRYGIDCGFRAGCVAGACWGDWAGAGRLRPRRVPPGHR
jgi:hypothetical protein